MKHFSSIILVLLFAFTSFAQQGRLIPQNLNDTTFYYNPPPKWGFTATFQIDIIDANFGQFANTIGAYNTEVLDGFVGVFNLELAATQNRKYIGATFGLLFADRLGDVDSLDIDLNKNLYALNFGYKIINTRKIILMPSLALKWYRYRLLNADSDTKISLNQYLNDREIDLRFNQAALFLGTQLSFKFPVKLKRNIKPRGYWTLGAYGGYLLKLHEKPIIYSRKSRLTTDHEIDLKNYNFGLFFSMNID